MLFAMKEWKPETGVFAFGSRVTAKTNPVLEKEIWKEFWKGHCFHASELEILETEDWVFALGDAPEIDCGDALYAIRVTETGAAVSAKCADGLRHGVLMLMQMIQPENLEEGCERLVLPCGEGFDTPALRDRMVHLCVFPETTLEFVYKFTRYCAALHATHMVVEFWGMYRYECMPELGWPMAYTKEQLQPIFREANDLGMEIIPMFNHWGHAAESRGMHGKHTVLDQNPRRQTLFSADGWAWRIEKPEVRKLMHEIRAELMELCGPGKYFHIGCDEVYGFEKDEKQAEIFVEYTREIAEELEAVGRRAILWGDMFLYPHPVTDGNPYERNCGTVEIETYFRENLDRRLVIADWHYDTVKAPLATSMYFKKAGFELLGCPWSETDGNTFSHVETAMMLGTNGVMHTTWHTLTRGMPYVATCMTQSWTGTDTSVRRMGMDVAALLRKIYFVDGNYEQAGWSKEQIGVRW